MKKNQEKQNRNPWYDCVTKRIQSSFPLFRKSYTYISTEMVFQGDIVAEKNLVVDGKMSGNIRSTKHVALGDISHFEGSISCQSASISGYVKGCIQASQSLSVKTPATIIGDLISASVHVEPGVVLHGKIFSDPQERVDQTPIPHWQPMESAPFMELVEN